MKPDSNPRPESRILHVPQASASPPIDQNAAKGASNSSNPSHDDPNSENPAQNNPTPPKSASNSLKESHEPPTDATTIPFPRATLRADSPVESPPGPHLNLSPPSQPNDAANGDLDDSDRKPQLRKVDWFKNDDFFAICLALGIPPAPAARLAGISRATAFRRMKEPRLEREVKDLRLQIRSNVVGSLIGGMRSAVEKLCGLLDSKSEQIQLAAAQQLLKHGFINAIEHGDPLFSDLNVGKLARLAEVLGPLVAEDRKDDDQDSRGK